MKREKTYEKLQSALLKQKFVRIVRKFEDADRIDGFVVAVSDEWALVFQTNVDLEPSGWSAIRVRDIKSIDKLGDLGGRDTQHRVLEALGEWPPPVPVRCLITDLSAVVSTAHGVAPIITVHKEAGRPDALWVGVVRSVSSEELVMLELSPQAHWASTLSDFEADDVTRVEFGSRYVASLALVAGDIPG